MPDIKKDNKKPTAPAPAAPAIASNRAAIARQAQQTLDLLHRRLTDAEARVANHANAFLTQAQSQQLQTLAQNSPELKDQLPALVASLQKVPTATQASQNTRGQALSGVRAKLQSFARAKS